MTGRAPLSQRHREIALEAADVEIAVEAGDEERGIHVGGEDLFGRLLARHLAREEALRGRMPGSWRGACVVGA